MTDDAPEEPIGYQSATDLPSYADLARQIAGLRALRLLLKKEDRARLQEIDTELRATAATVDDFYRLLGERHWIFHDRLSLPTIRDTVLRATTADAAELALCEIYRDRDWMRFMLGPFHRFPELNARRAMIDHAQRDYEEGRYYAVVLNLLTIMDGFVNDIQTVRRGLHTRDADELQSWDTAVGHHMGLTATQASFRKSYSRRVDEEFHDLARNGILHGVITNFDNIIVAGKAWNRLFAVVDWASSLEKLETPKAPEPTWGETMRKMRQNAALKVELDQWTPSAGTVSSPDEYATHPATEAASKFLELWMRTNWGHLADCFMFIGKGEEAKPRPQELRRSFAPFKLQGYTITGYEVTAPAVAIVKAELQIGNETFPTDLRMTLTNDEGETRVEGAADARWRVVFRSPETFNQDIARVAVVD